MRMIQEDEMLGADEVEDVKGVGKDSSMSGIARVRRSVGLDRYSGIYVAIALIVMFSVWEPTKFGTVQNARIIASSGAITGILTLGLLFPLIANVFDISGAATMTLSVSLVGQLQSALHLNAALAVLITLSVGALVGIVNAIIITRFHVQPIIATLGMSSILAAMAFWVSGANTILYGISGAFDKVGSATILTIPITVFYLVAVAILLWYVLDHTPLGRYLYATGANEQATRLSGLNTIRFKWTALITNGMLAALAGIILTMEQGAAPYDAGTPYLLPAFAVAFLGSTQVKPGRFNVWGTLVALYLLAIAEKGFQLQYPALPWIADLVEGVALIVAVAVGARAGRRSSWRL